MGTEKGSEPVSVSGTTLLSSPCISSLRLCQDGWWGENLEVTFHEMDAVVCLPRVNAEQKELGGKEALVYRAVLGGVS